ncbi:hypothetical protein TWF694_009691 [Orbilia ellipsospora]|uniref:Cryptic loci regulator 2 N-terminal domain-containing protein n=1 Tax=Orbilia ellipsospora TaxID=2528407 RepID=A0AAV9XBK9_9PEZI
MSGREAVVYSENGTVALVHGYGSRKVLRLALPTSDAITDDYPKNLKDNLKSISHKPGETLEWFVSLGDGEKQDLLYRTKLADAIVQSLGLPVSDDIYSGYILDRLPDRYRLFAQQIVIVDDSGVEHLKRTDTYLYGHPFSIRFRSPNEFFPHLLSILYMHRNSLIGLPKNTTLPYQPLHACGCKYCLGVRKNHAAPTSISKETPTMAAESSSRAQAVKTVAIQANLIQAAIETERDIKDGGWKFRKGEVVWAHLRLETAELGGTWFAAVVINGPETASFADYANIYTSVDQNRGFYRVQKCGSDTDVHMIHLSDLLPWTKVPQTDEPRNITVDEDSKAAAEEACSSYFIVARDANDHSIYDSTKIVYELKGLFLGPEKLWIGDAVRIPRKGGFLPDVSVWDPQQYDILIVRRIVLATTADPSTDEKGNVERVFIFYVLGDVLTMYPREGEYIAKHLDRKVPNYIKNIGTDRPKWVARTLPDGKQQVAALSTAYILSRFYDPRIMALMDRRWKTSDDVLRIERMLDNRAETLGFKSINGEPIRGSGRHRNTQVSLKDEEDEDDEDDEGSDGDQKLFTHGPPKPIFSEKEKLELVTAEEVMFLEQLEDYRKRSGNLAPPKIVYEDYEPSESSQGDGSSSRSKKRRMD